MWRRRTCPCKEPNRQLRSTIKGRVDHDRWGDPGRHRGRGPGPCQGVLDRDPGLRARAGRSLWAGAVAGGVHAGQGRGRGPGASQRTAADRSRPELADLQRVLLRRGPAADLPGAERPRRAVPPAARVVMPRVTRLLRGWLPVMAARWLVNGGTALAWPWAWSDKR